MSNYTVAVGPYTGSGPTQAVTFYESWNMDRNFDDGCTFSFNIPGYAPEAAAISELDTDIWLYLDGVLNDRFRIIQIDQSWGPSGEDTVSVQAVCYRRLLSGRYLNTDLRFDQVSQGQIIWELINHTQSQFNGDLGITVGNLGPTKLRDRTYETGQNILDVITDLCNVIDGPTWEIDENLQLYVSKDELFPTNPAPIVLGATASALSRPSGAARFANVAIVSGNQQETLTQITQSVGLTSIPNVLLGPASLTPSTTPTFGNNDDGYWTNNVGWNFQFLGQTYNTVYTGTNGYFTFGGGSTAFSGLDASNPPFRKIMIGAADNSVQRIYSGLEGTPGNQTYRIRVEGTAADTGVLGSPNRVYELTFFQNEPNRIELQIGTLSLIDPNVQGIYTASNFLYPFETLANSGYRFNTLLDPRGRWEKRASYPSVVRQQTLVDHSVGLLSEYQAPTTIWQVEVVRERFFTDAQYELGDFVTIIQPKSTAAPIDIPATEVRGQVIAMNIGQSADGDVKISMRVIEVPT